MKEPKPIYMPSGSPLKLAVLVSGSGSNMLSIHREQNRLEEAGEKDYGRIECVFTNVPNCLGAKRAEELGIPTLALSSKKYFEVIGSDPNDENLRNSYDAAVFSLIESVTVPDLIVLAGYRRRMGERIHSRYKNRIINLYPGDTTKKYLIKGVDASVQAIGAGESSIKTTVFFSRTETRFGPALIQSKTVSLKGFSKDNVEAMNEKIRAEGEWTVYPYAINELIAKGRVAVDDSGMVYIDGAPLGGSGLQMDEL